MSAVCFDTHQHFTSLLEAWGEENGILPAAPDAGSELRRKIIGFRRQGENATEKKVAFSDLVLRALGQRGRFYYDDSLRDFETAMYFDSEEKILHQISSNKFDAWLSNLIGINRASIEYKYVKAAVETGALDGDKTSGIIPESYWAAREGALYMSNGDGHAVKITSEGILKVDNGTDDVLFSAGKTLPRWNLVSPEDPFQTCDLFRSASYVAAHGLDLLRTFIISLFTTPRSKPPLSLSGTVGSGKTRLAKGIYELLGLTFRAQKAQEKGEQDFWPAVHQGGIFTLDNADTRIRWLPDALAAAATDGCSERRKLYGNSETVILRSRSAIIITSANPSFAADPGLADRLIVVRLNRRIGNTSDTALSDQIFAHRDAGLTFIAHTLSKALRDKTPVPEGLNSRYPDFAAFGVRVGRAIGREKETVEALQAAETDKARFCLENDEVGLSILNLVAAKNVIEGEASELLTHIAPESSSSYSRLGPRSLAKRLSGLWPHLEALFDAHKKTAHGGANYYRIATRGWAGPPSVSPEASGSEKQEVVSNPAVGCLEKSVRSFRCLSEIIKQGLPRGSDGEVPGTTSTDKTVGITGQHGAEKIYEQIRRAYEAVGEAGGAQRSTDETDFQPDKLEAFATRVAGFDEQWLAVRSPMRVRDTRAQAFLNMLYLYGETVLLFDDLKSQGQLWVHPGFGPDENSFPESGPNGPWFFPQPVEGQINLKPRKGANLQSRIRESVTKWRFLVLKCRHEKSYPDLNELWLLALIRLPLPIVAISRAYDNSVHAVLRVDAPSREVWDEIQAKLLSLVVPLGADEQAISPLALSPLPGCSREKETQRLLFFNLKPDGRPITEMRILCPVHGEGRVGRRSFHILKCEC